MRMVHKSTIYQLAFFQNLLPINCYFVEEEKELTLIDAALSFSAKRWGDEVMWDEF